MIRVFIGTDERGGRGEIVMAHGLRKFSSQPVEIANMRDGPGHWDYRKWNFGRKHFRPYSGEGWATNFTCFRFTVPEAAGFEGRAVYLDADQTVHADITELANWPLDGKCCAERMGVMVFDCGHPFWRSREWPRLDQMQRSGAGIGHYMALIKQSGLTRFEEAWDVLDGKEMSPFAAKLNHYTNMRLQPYHPFPDNFQYPARHPKPDVDLIWWRSYRSALIGLGQTVACGPKAEFDELLAACLDAEQAAGLNGFGRPDGFGYHFTDLKALAAELSAKRIQWRGRLPSYPS